MGSILAPASSAIGALGGVASGLSQIVQRTLQLVAAPFALIGNTAGAAGSVLAGGEVTVSSTIESPVQNGEQALSGGGGGEQALVVESALAGGETPALVVESALVGGQSTIVEAPVLMTPALVGGQSTILEAPVFIPIQNQTGMSGGARSRKRRASSPRRKGTRSKSRSRSRSRSRSGGKKKRTQKRKASPRRHRM
jgi:hypothetical protein